MKKISIHPPYLLLPKLQKRAVPNPDKLFQAHSELSIKPDAAFWTVWDQGPSDTSIAELERCMVVLGKAFCQLINAGQGKVKVSQKTSPQDLVTEVDKGIEMLLRLWIKRFYPHHKIIGEEGYKESFKSSDWVWYIDPVDGTSNFVEGNERVAMHVACIGEGKPLFSMVGLPMQDKLFYTQQETAYVWGYHTQASPQKVVSADWNELVALGTEYMSIRKTDAALAKRLTKKLGFPHYRVKSIGINLMDMLANKVSLFYRNRIKLWDVMAPMGILYYAAQGHLCFELGIPWEGTILTKQNLRWVSPFSHEDTVVHWLNNRHKFNSRVGLILVYPASHPSLKTILSDAVLG